MHVLYCLKTGKLKKNLLKIINLVDLICCISDSLSVNMFSGVLNYPLMVSILVAP